MVAPLLLCAQVAPGVSVKAPALIVPVLAMVTVTAGPATPGAMVVLPPNLSIVPHVPALLSGAPLTVPLE